MKFQILLLTYGRVRLIRSWRNEFTRYIQSYWEEMLIKMRQLTNTVKHMDHYYDILTKIDEMHDGMKDAVEHDEGTAHLMQIDVMV